LAKRKIKINDLFNFKFPGEVCISPDGKKIVYSIKTISKDRTKYHSNIFLYNIEKNENIQFTVGDHFDSSPVWSPDGKKIAFISDRDGNNQIYTISAHGGEAQKVSEFEEGSISQLCWSPCGSKIALIYTPKKKREPFEYTDEEDKKSLDVEKGKGRVLCRVVTRLRYKVDGGRIKEDERDHVFILNVATKKVKQITEGEYDDMNPVFFPDGKNILFVSNRTEDPDKNSLHSDLYKVSVDGGEIELLDTPPGPLYDPTISRNGNMIAYMGHDKPEDAWGVTNIHLWLLDLKTKECKNIVKEFDRTCTNVTVGDMRSSGGSVSPVFSEDESSIYFHASDKGNSRIFKVDIPNQTVEALTQINGDIVNFSFTEKRDRAAFILGTTESPGDIWIQDVNNHKNNLKRLTNLNQEILDNLTFSIPEEIHYKAKDGFDIHAWILKPPDFDPSRKYPSILEIHGGPRCQYANIFFFEFQILAAAGYVVYYANPRGGQGYGTKFAGTIINDWGNVDYQDLMSATDFMLDKDYIDPERLGVTGGSYGGFMTNWIIGHTNRYKAAVTQRSVTNLVSMFGTCDFGYDIPREFGGSPWKNREELLRMSPLTYVENINTPLLIIHSEQDLRTCIEQGEQLFVALKVLGKETTFVRFPEEGHELSRSGSPDRRAKRLEWIVKWFDDHLK